MIIEGYCRDCEKWYDAHWHNYPKGNVIPYCPYCMGTNTRWNTDETYEND